MNFSVNEDMLTHHMSKKLKSNKATVELNQMMK